eukprot:SAG11_NODE_6940_length_1222_cov_1.022262_1_plen_174_part_10
MAEPAETIEPKADAVDSKPADATVPPVDNSPAAVGGDDDDAAAAADTAPAADAAAATEAAPGEAAAAAAGSAMDGSAADGDVQVDVQLEVQKDKIGAIIGQGGSQIMTIERESGAKVKMPNREQVQAEGKAMVGITGTQTEADKATALIKAVVSEERKSSYQGPSVNIAGKVFA